MSLTEQIEKAIERHEVSTSCLYKVEECPNDNEIASITQPLEQQHKISIVWTIYKEWNPGKNNIIFNFWY